MNSSVMLWSLISSLMEVCEEKMHRCFVEEACEVDDVVVRRHERLAIVDIRRGRGRLEKS